MANGDFPKPEMIISDGGELTEEERYQLSKLRSEINDNPTFLLKVCQSIESSTKTKEPPESSTNYNAFLINLIRYAISREGVSGYTFDDDTLKAIEKEPEIIDIRRRLNPSALEKNKYNSKKEPTGDDLRLSRLKVYIGRVVNEHNDDFVRTNQTIVSTISPITSTKKQGPSFPIAI